MKLPSKMPSTFKIIHSNSEVFEIKYMLKVYFNDPEPIL